MKKIIETPDSTCAFYSVSKKVEGNGPQMEGLKDGEGDGKNQEVLNGLGGVDVTLVKTSILP